MQPELEIITKEIPTKGKGYMYIRRCWPDQVDSLIRQGYLRRVPDTADRRRVYLYLLPSSAPVTDRIDREWSAFDAKLFCGFGEEEKQQYDRFKELLMQNAETIMEEALAEGDGK